MDRQGYYEQVVKPVQRKRAERNPVLKTCETEQRAAAIRRNDVTLTVKQLAMLQTHRERVAKILEADDKDLNKLFNSLSIGEASTLIGMLISRKKQ